MFTATSLRSHTGLLRCVGTEVWMNRLGRLTTATTAALSLALLTPLVAREAAGGDPGVGHLDHVFVIVMENHAYDQIVGNPNAPFTNAYAKTANTADNYFAIGHPSLTNYLELVGASNFGVLSDNSPDWHNHACKPNIVQPYTQNRDDAGSGAICPIAGSGMDAQTVGKTIADQLAERGRSWKSYQESLPPYGPDGVNNSDGFFNSTTGFASVLPKEQQSLINLYAAKHNPFVYFRRVQEHGLGNVAGFQGPRGLFDDLAAGNAPDYALIAPNQCNDQHGRGNAGPACDFDPGPLGDGTYNDGSSNFLNPALIYQGDLTLRTIVGAIHSSKAWRQGHNAIVVVWDENDYSAINNKVLVIVDTNDGDRDGGDGGVHSLRRYTHFSLLKTIQAGLGLPCLNHTCDVNVPLMEDVFGR
jgi:hypothetical protein